jgi:hypothetical protein
MLRHQQVFVLYTAGIVALCSSLGCGRTSPPPAPGSLELKIIYHEKHCLQGINMVAVDGIAEYVFRNRTTALLTIKMPPDEVYSLSTNSRCKLEQSDWPDFATASDSFTLPPGGQRRFTSQFCMDVVKANKDKTEIGPNLCVVFGSSSSKNEKQEEAFTGTVTSESFWDDSLTIDVSDSGGSS